MKKSWQVPAILLFSILFLNNVQGFSQQFTDELRLKLPKPDQYKLLKAGTFNSQGKTYLSKAQTLADSLHLNEDQSPEPASEKGLKEYYSGRIKASYCFRNANGLLFGVLDKHIREFWKKYKEDKKPLEMIVKVENAAYDSLVKGDKLRENAERKLYMEDKIPLVSQAETIEQDALLKLEKVLFVYLNWPVQPNLAWLYSDDTVDPYNKLNQNKEIQLSSIRLDTATVKKDTVPKASSLYSLMHISESQIDRFNEFLKKTHPDKMEAYLIDFQKLYDVAIDSLHKEWLKYLSSGMVPLDTLKSTPIETLQSNPKPTFTKNEKPVSLNKTLEKPANTIALIQNETPNTTSFLYKVQISASRTKIGSNEQHKIYTGNEKIYESFEDRWFKYTIGSFQTYSEARRFRDELKSRVKGVFVIAYFNGKRIKITTSLIRNNKEALKAAGATNSTP